MVRMIKKNVFSFVRNHNIVSQNGYNISNEGKVLLSSYYFTSSPAAGVVLCSFTHELSS